MMSGFKLIVPEPIGESLQPIELVKIDFDAVAKKEDVDRLRDAVLEILDVVRATDRPDITKVIGPACDKLLEERTEAGR